MDKCKEYLLRSGTIDEHADALRAAIRAELARKERKLVELLKADSPLHNESYDKAICRSEVLADWLAQDAALDPPSAKAKPEFRGVGYTTPAAIWHRDVDYPPPPVEPKPVPVMKGDWVVHVGGVPFQWTLDYHNLTPGQRFLARTEVVIEGASGEPVVFQMDEPRLDMDMNEPDPAIKRRLFSDANANWHLLHRTFDPAAHLARCDEREAGK